MRALLILAALAITACRPAADKATQTAPEATGATAAGVTHYTCEDGAPAQVKYVGDESATVVIGERVHTLSRVVSASGARYTGDGLQWWSKGDQAFRAPLKPGEDVASAAPVLCWSGEPPPVEPPAPGQPGGLPDDRTPVSEAPFPPESAQGAANVVQTFYANLERGRMSEAASMMRAGAPPDVTGFSSYHALIGAPGPIEGAAGSLFVEVPVVIYGRLSTGQPHHEAGKVVLRRANDVPGSTPEQRTWRIERIELKQPS